MKKQIHCEISDQASDDFVFIVQNTELFEDGDIIGAAVRLLREKIEGDLAAKGKERKKKVRG